MSRAMVTKRPDETYPVGLIYTSPDIEEGETCVSCVVEIDPVESGGLSAVFDPVVEDDRVSQMLTAGLDGHEYKVKFKTTTSGGHTYEDFVLVLVRDF